MSEGTTHDATNLPDDPILLKQIIAEQSELLDQQRTQIEKMKHEMEQLKRMHFGPRSERLVPEQMLMPFAGQSFPAQLPPPGTLPRSSGRDPQHFDGAKAIENNGHGRQKLPDHLKRVPVVHDVPEDRKRCTRCKKKLVKIGEETSEQLEYTPSQLKVLKNIRPKYTCPDECEECGIVIAPPPSGPIEMGPVARQRPGERDDLRDRRGVGSDRGRGSRGGVLDGRWHKGDHSAGCRRPSQRADGGKLNPCLTAIPQGERIPIPGNQPPEIPVPTLCPQRRTFDQGRHCMISRNVKWIAARVAALLVLIALPLAGLAFLGPEWLKTKLVQMALEKLHADLRIESLTFSPWSGEAELKGIGFDRTLEGSEVHATVASVRMKLHVLPLLRRSVQIDLLEADRPAIAWTLQQPPDSERATTLAKIKKMLSGKTKGPERRVEFRIDELILRDGSVDFTSMKPGREPFKAVATGIQYSARSVSLDSFGRLLAGADLDATIDFAGSPARLMKRGSASPSTFLSTTIVISALWTCRSSKGVMIPRTVSRKCTLASRRTVFSGTA